MAGDERALEERVDELLLIRDCHGTMAPPVGRPVFSDDELNGMEVPVLYVVGENDGVCDDPRAAVARVNAVAPRIETMLVPGAGHDALVTRREVIAARVVRFLGEDA